MTAGLVLTVLASIAPLVDRATSQRLAEHIRDGYPAYTDARVDSAVTAYVVLLGLIGALGVASWLGIAWAIRRRARWARPAATAMFVVGTGVALTALLIEDTSGDVGLDPVLGWIGMAPSVPGLVAVVLLWRPRPRRSTQ